MAVRSASGRVRYVAFRVDGGPVGRSILGGALPEGAKLTRFDGTHGILRTTHRLRDALLEDLARPLLLAGREVRVVTIATSGTIRGAAARLPPGAPAARREPRRKPSEAG